MKQKFFMMAAIAAACVFASSCKKSAPLVQATVTVKSFEPAGECVLQLDDKTILKPSNMAKSPYEKETRAMVIYADNGDIKAPVGSLCQWKAVTIQDIAAILTKDPVASGEALSTDGLEIYRSWVNTIEDGYVTLAFEAKWGTSGRVHYINLEETAEPYTFVLKHDKNGDDGYLRFVSSLVAFDLHGLLPEGKDEQRVYIQYEGYSGEQKSIYFQYKDGSFSGPYSEKPYELQAGARSDAKFE